MKRFSSLLSQLTCACALFLNDFCYADNVNEESFFQKNKEVLSIRNELEDISAKLSDLENMFIYENKDTLAETMSIDILLRLDQLENRLASAIGFLEKIENRVEKTTRLIISRIADIDQTLAEMDGEKSLPGTLIDLYDEIPESADKQVQKLMQLPEDRREYLSVKSIFDDGNYELAIEEFTSFLERFSGSELSLQVKFWRSESYLRLNLWPSAAEGFLEVFSADPNGSLSVYSLFGLALSLSELGELGQSCSALQEIKNRDVLKFNEFQEQLTSYGKNLNCDFGG